MVLLLRSHDRSLEVLLQRGQFGEDGGVPRFHNALHHVEVARGFGVLLGQRERLLHQVQAVVLVVLRYDVSITIATLFMNW